MTVIAMVGNKGGAGKTTLAINLAAGLAGQANTIMVDADPQGSTAQWRAIADDDRAPEVQQSGEDMRDHVRSLAQQYEFVVVDCPPSVHAPQTHHALEVCDIALIPVQPSPIDLWATVHIEDSVNRARDVNPGLKVMMVINQLEPRTILSRLVQEALAEIELPVANTAIRRRAVYRACALEGKSIFAMGSRGREATEELEELIKEVIAI